VATKTWQKNRKNVKISRTSQNHPKTSAHDFERIEGNHARSDFCSDDELGHFARQDFVDKVQH
jgi:hypothetical protein